MEHITQLHSLSPKKLEETFVKIIDERLSKLERHFTQKEPNEFITAKELEKQLKISAVTRWQWQKKGILKPRKIANRTYYLASDIKELLINSK